MQKVPDAPHEVLLVLDGSTGQNAGKAKEFTKSHRSYGPGPSPSLMARPAWRRGYRYPDQFSIPVR
jgi:hypothetical protein